MQSYFITRGKYEEVDIFITWLRCQVLPLLMKQGDGSTITRPMECVVRPIQLWEFVHPREYKDLVANSLGLYSQGSPFRTGGYNINPKLFVLRKLLGATPFEEPKDKITKLMLPYERFKNINILGIGYTDDGDITQLKTERI